MRGGDGRRRLGLLPVGTETVALFPRRRHVTREEGAAEALTRAHGRGQEGASLGQVARGLRAFEQVEGLGHGVGRGRGGGGGSWAVPVGGGVRPLRGRWVVPGGHPCAQRRPGLSGTAAAAGPPWRPQRPLRDGAERRPGGCRKRCRRRGPTGGRLRAGEAAAAAVWHGGCHGGAGAVCGSVGVGRAGRGRTRCAHVDVESPQGERVVRRHGGVPRRLEE